MEYQIEAKRRIRIGVVGVGSHCYRNILPTLTYLPVELVAVADRDIERAKSVGRQYGATPYGDAASMYERENLEAVLMCVSPHLHPDLAIEAFNAGLHVWMEKPAATRANPVRDVIAARGDHICVVGYKKAFMPALRKALAIIANLQPEPLKTVLGVYPCSLPADSARSLEQEESTEWLANGCHPLSALLAIGGQVTSVRTIRSAHAGGMVVLKHTNGAVSNLHLPHGAPTSQPFERYLIVAGQHSIEIENARRLIYQRGIDFSYSHGTDFTTGTLDNGAIVWEAQDGLNTLENKAVFTQGVYGSLDEFLRAVLTGKQPTIGSLEFAHHLSLVWEAVLLSEENEIAV